MNSVRAISALMRFELSHRSPVLLVALAVGIATLPLAAFTRQQPVVFAVALGIAFCLAAAGLLGSAMLAEPLSQGRIGFFLAQPIGVAALWWGRLLGATLVAILAATAAVAPAWLWRATRLHTIEVQALQLWALGLLAALPFAALGHVAATLGRSRGGRVAVDVAAALVVAALAGAAWRKLDAAGPAGAAHAAWVLPVVLLPLLCIAAGHAQLWRGRGDVPRGHLGLSATLWSPLLVVSAGALAIVGWTLDLAPGDIHLREEGKMVTAARSPWAVVEGAVLDTEPGLPHRLRYGFSAQFLLDLETGDWARLGPATHFERRRGFPAATPALAADGGRLAFRSSDGDSFFVDLPRSRGRDASSSRARELDLTPRPLPPDFADAYAWALSPDGRHLAAVLVRPRGAAQPVGLGRYLGSLRVVSLPEGTPVFSGELPWQAMSDELSEQPLSTSLSTLSVNLRWVDGTRLELAGCLAPTNPQRPDREAVAVPIHAAFASLDLALPGFATELTRMFAEPGCARYQLSSDGRIAVYRQIWWAGDAALRSTNGDPPVSLERPDRRSLATAVGATWVAQLDAVKEPSLPLGYQSDVRLRWFDRTGEAHGEVAVAERAMAVFGGEVVPGQILVLVTEPPEVASTAPKARQRLLLLDPLAGTLTSMPMQLREGVTLHPVASYTFSWVGPHNQMLWTPEPGSPATRLLATNDNSVVWLEAARGSLRAVQAGPGSRDRLVVDR